MSVQITCTPHFKSNFKKLSAAAKEKVEDAILGISDFKTKGTAPYGLRIKMLRHKIYEARVDLATRIVFFSDKRDVRFIAVGNHEDILRTLKQIDQIHF